MSSNEVKIKQGNKRKQFQSILHQEAKLLTINSTGDFHLLLFIITLVVLDYHKYKTIIVLFKIVWQLLPRQYRFSSLHIKVNWMINKHFVTNKRYWITNLCQLVYICKVFFVQIYIITLTICLNLKCYDQSFNYLFFDIYFDYVYTHWHVKNWMTHIFIFHFLLLLSNSCPHYWQLFH